jgi:hypothetical protein
MSEFKREIQFIVTQDGVADAAYDGFVSPRADKYNLFCLFCGATGSRGPEDADRGEGPGEDVQSAVIGGNMLVAV